MSEDFLIGDGKVMIGAVTLHVTGWDFSPDCAMVDFTHSGSGRYATVRPGKKSATGVIRIDCNVDELPTSFSLTVGTLLSNLQLYLNATKKVTIPTAYVSSTPYAAGGAEGKVEFTCNFTVSGSWTEAA